MVRVVTPRTLRALRWVPSLPAGFRRKYDAPRGPWPELRLDVPPEFLTQPGVERDQQVERLAYEQQPLHSFHHNYGPSVIWALQRLWLAVIPVGPRLMRAIDRVSTIARQMPASPPASIVADISPQGLTHDLRAAAAALGLGAIGVTEYDEKYLFADLNSDPWDSTVIVCALEQNWKATQTIPGPHAEQTALSTNAALMDLTSRLAEHLQRRGFRARPYTTEGQALVHHFAVEAGLGQMGVNGQLLTPSSGSRVRLSLISTNARLVLDHPVDYGIGGVCDRCQVCVRRCPSGAIPTARKPYRGVVKSKLNLSRCFPVVARAYGCAICMKVCPVQRYGLPRVIDHYRNTGEILGKGTDELEGYTWPFDGVRYGPGQRPTLPPAFFRVPGFMPGEPPSQGQHGGTVVNPLM
jgi:ferredoxin